MKKAVLALLLTLALLGSLGMTALAEVGFSDVAAGAWYRGAVEFVRERGLMSGTSATTFSPDATTSRAMLVTILHREADSPAAEPSDFSDVAADAWYRGAADWAAAEGILSGYSDGRFAPDEPVTREQLGTILWRAAGSPSSTETWDFADQGDISAFAAPAVAWAREQGIVSGKSGNRFDPKGATTRAELAVILHRWLRGPVPTPPESPAITPTPEPEEEAAMPGLTLQVGERAFAVTLEDNETTRAFVAGLPTTMTMGELNGNEKYYYLPERLPTSSRRPGTIHAGDLMLYGSNCLVLFYETFSSGYSYTPMGSVDDPAALSAALGRGEAEVRFEKAYP